MRTGRIEITTDLLHKLLQLPSDIVIVEVNRDPLHPSTIFSITVEGGESLPEHKEGEIPLLEAIVHTERYRYEFKRVEPIKKEE